MCKAASGTIDALEQCTHNLFSTAVSAVRRILQSPACAVIDAVDDGMSGSNTRAAV